MEIKKIHSQKNFKKTGRPVQHLMKKHCLIMDMKNTLTKIVALIISAMPFLKSPKKENAENADAIRIPGISDTHVVEDFEMAAYHQQA